MSTRDHRGTGEEVGVDATPGGQHQIWGTRNALISIGSRNVSGNYGTGSDPFKARTETTIGHYRLYKPRLVTWVCRSADLDKTIELGKQLGVDLGEVQSGRELGQMEPCSHGK